MCFCFIFIFCSKRQHDQYYKKYRIRITIEISEQNRTYNLTILTVLRVSFCFVIVSTRVYLFVCLCDDSTRILKSHIISLRSLGQIKKKQKINIQK